ncbi:hypothetical protein GDO81_025395 [Engystomops pustulosus]|uniref:G-protein coupled receptors family 3 profile domain-containing protein n=1 Tax=Engystomops pustulosus TaxID=76066 RepID=A0AAV6ZSN1_ENGPU|nr:hypothetical protein GDO81_025395 [Engystomops pustulosus]
MFLEARLDLGRCQDSAQEVLSSSPLRSGSFHLMAALSWTLLSLAVLCSNGQSGDQSTDPELEILGVFPVYSCDYDYEWDSYRSYFYKQLQLLEAMNFAIEEINRNSTILPGIKLIPSIAFFCIHDTMQTQLEDLMKSHPVAAVVGTVGEVIPDQIVAHVERSKVPVITYATRALESRKRPYLLSMAPPVQSQFKAVVDLLVYYNWTYVSLVTTSDETFTSGLEEFKKEAERHGICFATTVIMCYNNDYDHVIGSLSSHPKARVVVLFADLSNLRNLLSAADLHRTFFTWVVGAPLRFTEKIVEKYKRASRHVITLEIQSHPLPRFNEYFQARIQAKVHKYRDPQFRAFFSRYSFRSLPDEDRIVKPESKKQFQSSYQIQSVVNAVYAIAHALQNMSSSTCPNMSADCVREHNDTFMTFLRKTRFTAPFTPPDVQYTVNFDEEGYGPARYRIFTIQEIMGHYQYQQIGSWAEKLKPNPSHRMWESNSLPESCCSKPCGKHEVKMTVPGYPCCWVCIMCQPNEVLLNETTCKECDPGYQPNTDHSGCISYIQWGDGLAIGSLCFSSLGILSTIFVGAVLLRNNNTPIVPVTALCASISLCALVILGGVFVPKLYIIFCHPEKNVKSRQ